MPFCNGSALPHVGNQAYSMDMLSRVWREPRRRSNRAGFGHTESRPSGQGAGNPQMNEKESGRLTGRKPIKGDVMPAEYGDYFAKGQDGKEVRLHTDKNTQMMGQIRKGDCIEAKVNDQNHMLSTRLAQ